jgi:hypothetical protein
MRPWLRCPCGAGDVNQLRVCHKLPLAPSLAQEKELRKAAQVAAGISPDDDDAAGPAGPVAIAALPAQAAPSPEAEAKARLEGKLANIRKQLLKSQQLYGTAGGGV